jgi:pyruvate dehydrogenase E1 component alpha subunit
MRGTAQVSLAFFGDGAANCGPFHESLNLAAIWSLPVVFLCENNGYAATTRSANMTAVADVSDRAAGYSMPGLTVDGQDVLAAWRATSDAVTRARAGEGPTLLDVKTYRFREHAEFGRIGRSLSYRSDEEIEQWRARDPIEMFIDVLLADGTLDADATQRLRDEVRAAVDEAVAFARESPYPATETAYENVFTEPAPVWH